MSVLTVLNHPICGQAQRKRVALHLALILTLVGGFAPQAVTPKAQAAFPGRNGRIAFAVPRVASNTTREFFGGDVDRDLYMVTPPSGVITQLTSGPEEDWAPAWSPGGEQLAFTRRVGLAAGDIYVLNVANETITNVTSTPESNDFYPSWSPDGTKLVFASDRGNPSAWPYLDMDLYVMDVATRQTLLLTDMEGVQAQPAWSPRGDVIAFQDRTSNSIHIISASGGNTIRIASGEEPGGPSWAPDGRRLVFTTTSGDIWIVNRDGSGLRKLTRGLTFESNASWSPDGEWIAFVSDRDGSENPKLYRMKLDGSQLQKIVDINLVADPFAIIDWGPRP